MLPSLTRLYYTELLDKNPTRIDLVNLPQPEAGKIHPIRFFPIRQWDKISSICFLSKPGTICYTSQRNPYICFFSLTSKWQYLVGWSLDLYVPYIWGWWKSSNHVCFCWVLEGELLSLSMFQVLRHPHNVEWWNITGCLVYTGGGKFALF